MQVSSHNYSIQPYKLANKEGELKFGWKVKDFNRLAEALFDDSGNIEVKIEGYFDLQKRCLLKCQITAQLVLECQTTFEGIDYNLDKQVVYCCVSSESQLAEIDEEFEAVLTEEGYLDIAQLIEDELILSVPIVANKPQDKINQTLRFGELDEEAIAKEKEKANPFAVLKDLKKT
ncbi:MAG: YceD family protein [Kangiellaceae bacterium]|nr:YceD family protein [Kangiellaceae bacterium]MCW9000270.1 YceD family protein [Kangiellaceae bacterium]